ncbi:hypothetical protein LDO51_13435 [Providencia alcalifaciens]|uniref:hypothetical protein n=1 Tax=Providencia alcalifaciens TaxID=126385 RepID=UPI001CE1A43B|nr:hypothetical protein [Providencia alcalifaciens]UBX48156.1 hypothetical protein LDO51_13435 [Providencia alcalifaciens]
MFNYLATVEFVEDEGVYEINFCDFPDIQGVAYCAEDVELEAHETLLATLSELITLRNPIPLPQNSVADAFVIHLPVLSCLKIALHNAILKTQTPRSKLARTLNINAQQIERLLDLQYASKIEALEQALFVVGYDVKVTVSPIV